MENTFQVQPVSLVSVTQLSKAKFITDELNCQYYAEMKGYTAENQHVQDFKVEFTQEEYDNWGSGDAGNTYIYNLIFQKLGFQLI